MKSVSKGRMIIFNGQRSSYFRWQEKFITCVHMKKAPVVAKALALQASLDVKNKTLRLIVETMSLSEEGYRDVIEDLEEEYGGPHRLRQVSLQEVLEGDQVTCGDSVAVMQLEQRLKSYVQAVEKSGHQGLLTREDETFSLVASKLESDASLKYVDWLTQSGCNPCISSLLQFLKVLLSRQRRMNYIRASKVSSSTEAESRTQRENTLLAPQRPPKPCIMSFKARQISRGKESSGISQRQKRQRDADSKEGSLFALLPHMMGGMEGTQEVLERAHLMGEREANSTEGPFFAHLQPRVRGGIVAHKEPPSAHPHRVLVLPERLQKSQDREVPSCQT